MVADAGLPAVAIGTTGELRPAAGRAGHARAAGRRSAAALLRAVTAIDEAGPIDPERAARSPAFAGGPDGIVTMRNVLPDWAVRLLVGTLLLPALLAALDGCFRARRRHLPVGRWAGWIAAGALPRRCSAWLWLRALGLTGALDGPGHARASRTSTRSAPPGSSRSSRPRSSPPSAGSACAR